MRQDADITEHPTRRLLAVAPATLTCSRFSLLDKLYIQVQTKPRHPTSTTNNVTNTAPKHDKQLQDRRTSMHQCASRLSQRLRNTQERLRELDLAR